MASNLDFQTKTFTDLQQELEDELKAQQIGIIGNPKIADFSFYSLASILIRSLAAVLARAWTYIQLIVSNFYISTATGTYLVRRFADFGFQMLVGNEASGQVQVIRPAGSSFTGSVNSGDQLQFGSLLFNITSGSTSFGSPSTNRTARVITIQAAVNGIAGNLAANTILSSNSLNYQDLIFVVGTALDSTMTNATQGGLSGGLDDETADQARIRFQTYIQNIGEGTIAAIQASVDAVDGVRSATVYDTTRLDGSGNLETGYPGYIVVSVLPTTITGPTLDPTLLSSINSAVLASKAGGISVAVQQVNARVIDVTVTAGTTLSSTDPDFLNFAAQVQTVLQVVFDSLNVDDPLYTNIVNGQIASINPILIPGGTSAAYTYDVAPNAGASATDVNGKITPDTSGNGQILSLGSVTVNPVSL